MDLLCQRRKLLLCFVQKNRFKLGYFLTGLFGGTRVPLRAKTIGSISIAGSPSSVKDARINDMAGAFINWK